MKKSLFVLIVLLFVIKFNILAQPAGYTYGKVITIDHTQVTATQTNFPFLISISSDTDLKSVANGGHVQSGSGYDITFTDDAGTALSFQIEKYVATTGQYIAWVKIPSLSSTTDTKIGMYYGNATVVSDPSSTSSWDANYKGVYHFNNSITDKTSVGNDLTEPSTATANFSGSKIGEGRDLNNSSNTASSGAGRYLKLPNSMFSGHTSFSFEGWVYLDRYDTNWERIFDFGASTTKNFFLTPSDGTGSPANVRGRITTGGSGSEQGTSTSQVPTTGSWVHWAVVLDDAANTLTVYKNGASLASAAGVTLNASSVEASTANYFGRSQYAADHYIDAKFDEFRISNIARSSTWISTSYNNQNAPSSFSSITSELSAAATFTALPIELISFTGKPNGSKVDLVWSTATETNNDFFTIEKSLNGSTYTVVTKTNGAGNSTTIKNYSTTDDSPTEGTSYYRLKQTDYNGDFAYSAIIAIDYSKKGNGCELTVYPNPCPSQCNIDLAGCDESENPEINVQILDAGGNEVFSKIPMRDDKGSFSFTIDSQNNLKPGVYIIRGVSRKENYSKKVIVK